jgi:hypothetical protein
MRVSVSHQSGCKVVSHWTDFKKGAALQIPFLYPKFAVETDDKIFLLGCNG